MNTFDIGVRMECDTLLHFPQIDFPAGYAIRHYQPGDEAAWQHLHRIGDSLSKCEFNDALFVAQFGSDPEPLRSRMFYVTAPNGDSVGTITAWFTDEVPARGRIHWVIVHPEHRRRGLTKPMMTHAMRRLAQDHSLAMLDTSLGRPWAIKVYLDFGFHPTQAAMADPLLRQGWATLQEQLQHPLLQQWLEQGIDQVQG